MISGIGQSVNRNLGFKSNFQHIVSSEKPLGIGFVNDIDILFPENDPRVPQPRSEVQLPLHVQRQLSDAGKRGDLETQAQLWEPYSPGNARAIRLQAQREPVPQQISPEEIASYGKPNVPYVVKGQPYPLPEKGQPSLTPELAAKYQVVPLIKKHER